jgi:hypothetical protein
MVNNKQIHEFAIKWFEKYRNSKTTELEVIENFADECFACGFKMDCGKSFEDAFPNTKAFEDYTQFNKLIDQVDNIQLLGSTIFSKWRYITHWSYCDDLLSPENRPWFIIALSRLAVLSSEDGCSPFVFYGQAKKIRIISNNTRYGPSPMPEDEVQQHLTITDDGHVQFSGYNFGSGSEAYEQGRKKTLYLDKEKMDLIFTAFSRFFSGEFYDVFATDIGFWEMTITNTEGRDFLFRGSLCADYEIDGIDLSEMLRDALDIENLFAFDGNNKPDKVERISIDYHRVTKIKPKALSSETLDTVTWDYTEQLVVDRGAESIEHIQRVGSSCIVTHKYQVEEGVSSFLDSLDAESLFENIEGNPPDVVENPNETKDYVITVDFKKKPQLVLKGTYDKNGLPEDWPEFAEEIWSFMRFYGFGEILDPSIYRKAKRRTGDYIFCSVEFDEGSKSYYYLTDDDALKVGDFVIVPVGHDGHTAVVEVVDIEYYSEEHAPFPINKMKRIIRKCSNEDFEYVKNDD